MKYLIVEEDTTFTVQRVTEFDDVKSLQAYLNRWYTGNANRWKTFKVYSAKEVKAEFELQQVSKELPPIEHDEIYDRDYIPLPGGWEIQTKGGGSTFRICDTKSGERMPVAETMLHPWLERMAREVRAAFEFPR